MIVNNFPSSYAVVSPDSIFSYNGKYEFYFDGEGNWECKFLTSGSLTISKKTLVDIFLVGGGGSGGNGARSDNAQGTATTYYAGGGGGGGECITQSSVQMQRQNTYALTIGAGGNDSDGGNSSFVVGSTSYVAQGGKRGNDGNAASDASKGGEGGNFGGDGGVGTITHATSVWSITQAPQDGYSGGGSSTYHWNSSTKAFGENDGALYAGGGGGGNPFLSHSGYANLGAGGAGGGGKHDADGTANTGGGGGGGGQLSSSSPGGKGGSGIIIIRNHRSS